MAITMHFKDGIPADDAEITSAPTNLGKLDDEVAGLACVAHRLENRLEDSKYYDAKQLFSYAAGTWQVIHDESRGDQNTLVQLRIVVTDAAGTQLRIIHDFGQVSITAGANDQLFSQAGIAQQDLLATERLAVFIIHDGVDGERMETGVEIFDGTCDSRLVTPDAVAVLRRPRMGATLSGPTVI